MSDAARWFTIDEAQSLMPAVHERAARLIPLRADLARRARALEAGDRTQRAELKALEAHLSELLDWFREQGIQLKGYAPLLIDFPMRADERVVLLCWLENEPELAWFHHADDGFLGRRPLS
ncbi:MAG: hypothetical protein QOD72_1092, partial [Acidimicrobiaceae bacterium]|nr:hypothetical protein [Acidimicrobiaceae bacterium]